MANEARDLMLYARLVDLHRRRTEAEMMGHSTKVHDALIELYRLELAEIEALLQAKRDAA